MLEVEVKILEINRQEIEEKLKKMGAKKIFEDYLEAIYFEYKDKSLKNAGKLLRLRKEGKKTILTLKEKEKTKFAKVAKEFEVEVKDFDMMQNILKLMNLEIVHDSYIYKKRVSWVIEKDHVHFDFDKPLKEYNLIPEFMEIESTNKETIIKFAKILGFKLNDLKPWSFKDVKKHYLKK